MANINDTFFEGHYKQIWRSLIPDELTVKEVDFMLPYFKLEPGHHVLDLMCGYGRHALSLARKGIHVTAVDNLGEYTSEITETAHAEQLPLKVVKSDVIQYKMQDRYQLAICMGNSLNFFDAADLRILLRHIADHLVPGGHFLINSWSIAEIAFKNFKEKSWSRVGDLKFLTDSRILFHPTRMETESIIISETGETETKTGVDYIYSLNELEKLLQESGLRLQEVYSIPGRKKFSIGEPRAYLIASRT